MGTRKVWNEKSFFYNYYSFNDRTFKSDVQLVRQVNAQNYGLTNRKGLNALTGITLTGKTLNAIKLNLFMQVFFHDNFWTN